MKKLILFSLASLMISGCTVPDNPNNKPSNLTYTPDSLILEYSQPVSLSPSNKGGKIDCYTINTTLPDSLHFDDQTGKISGKAVVPIDSQTFIITGTNEYGTVSTKITVSIKKRNTPPELKILSPANEACALLSPVNLVWSGKDIDNDPVKYAVFSGSDSTNLQCSSFQADTFLLFHAAGAKTIYWKILASDGKDSVESAVRSFSTNHAPFIKINAPEDGTSETVNSVMLKWEYSDSDAVDKNSLICRIFLDTVNPPKKLLADSITSSSFSLTDLFFWKKYYWKVMVSDSKDCTASNVYSFKINKRNTPPELKLISPANAASALPSPVNLVWSGKDIDGDTVKYTVFTGSDTSNLQISSVQTDTSFHFQTTVTKKVFWKIVASDGKDSLESQIRSFTANYAPSVIITSPPDGSSDLVNPVVLKWNCSDSDIIDKNSLICRIFLDTVNPPKKNLADSITSLSYTLPDLLYGENYYWKVQVTDSKDSTISKVYSFQTGLPAKITSQPFDDTLNLPDGCAGFSIAASGKNINYQWLKNNIPVPNTNVSFLTISNGVNGDRYRCVVWNEIGNKDTSKEAILHLAYLSTTTIIGSGSVTPSNPFIVHGTDQVFYFNGDSGSVVSRINIDDIDVNPAALCTLKNVTTNHKLTVQYYKVPPLLKKISSKNKTFNMGKDDPGNFKSYPVTFTCNYYMDSTEVTRLNYEYYLNLPLSPLSYSNYPVDSITWYNAVLYCNARSKKEGLDTVYKYSNIIGSKGSPDCILENLTIDYKKIGYRLPTEAEWEFACRAGTTTDFYWGENMSDYSSNNSENPVDVSRYAVIWQNNPSPVASKLPNAFRLYDMSGNVYEFCNDWYGSEKTPGVDPTGPLYGSQKIIKGGDVLIRTLDAITSYWYYSFEPKSIPYSYVGFRCVLVSR